MGTCRRAAREVDCQGTFTLVAAGGLLAFVAFAGTVSPAPSRLRPSPRRQLRISSKVAVSDMFEIQSNQLALEKQPDKDTKRFARRMVKDHEKTRRSATELVC